MLAFGLHFHVPSMLAPVREIFHDRPNAPHYQVNLVPFRVVFLPGPYAVSKYIDLLLHQLCLLIG